MPRKRRLRDEVKATYRFDRTVKDGIAYTAEVAGRSENLQTEYLVKLGLLLVSGMNPKEMTQQEINSNIEDLFSGNEDD